MIHSGEPYHPGFVAEWAADWKTAWEAVAPLIPAERRRLVYLEQATVKLHRLLQQDEYWAALAAIVDNLLAHETLEGEEVEDIVRQWLR
jgi:ATP-dependent Zn protease